MRESVEISLSYLSFLLFSLSFIYALKGFAELFFSLLLLMMLVLQNWELNEYNQLWFFLIKKKFEQTLERSKTWKSTFAMVLEIKCWMVNYLNEFNMYFWCLLQDNVGWKICSGTNFIQHHPTWFFFSSFKGAYIKYVGGGARGFYKFF